MAEPAPVEIARAGPILSLPPRLPFLIRHRLWILLAITLLGGGMRFYHLEKPVLWGDEGFTYSRICGDYREMLDVLVYDGFPPLHYEAYWLLKRAGPLTPQRMRVIPATAGTLMIPAIYFLAVQIVRKRTALLAALFTASSAYMMVYSRDAKMYMAAWLFVTLNAACLLLWLRTRARLAWLAWVATGLAMAGFHLASMAVLGVELVILLTWRFQWRAALLFMAGVAVVGAGPAGYKLGFNRWDDQIDEVGFAMGSGLMWIEPYNQGRTGPDLALFAATAHLFSWEWPSHPMQIARPGIDPDVMHVLMIVGTALLTLMAIGAISWRASPPAIGVGTAGDDPDRIPGDEASGWKTIDGHPVSESAYLLDYLSPGTQHAGSQPWFGQDDPPAHPAWRQLLWLGLWIIVPAYGIYCASMRHFASPLDWIENIGDLFELHWIILGIEIVLLAGISHFWKALPRYLTAVIPIAALLALVVTALHFEPGRFFDRQQWRTAYWPILSFWWDGLSHPAVMMALAGVLPVIAWQFCGHTFRQRSARTGQWLLVVGAIVLACACVYRYSVYRFDQLTQKVLADHHDAPQWEMLVQAALKDHGVPLRGMTLTELPDRFGASSLAAVQRRANAEYAAAKSHWNKLMALKSQSDRAAAEQLVAEQIVWDRWWSVWMPRYLGMCWPAIAVAACVLLMRLPTAPLRYLAIMLLLAVNVCQSSARVFAGSEPPLDRIYTDIAAAQETIDGKPTGTRARTYLSQMSPLNIGHPGSLGVFGMAGRYYLSIASGQPVKPLEFRDFRSSPRQGEPWLPWGFRFATDLSPGAIAAELERSPQVDRVIVWERADHLETEGISDRLAERLGTRWKRRPDEQVFYGRDHWTWTDYFKVRRRVFERQPMPATQP